MKSDPIRSPYGHGDEVVSYWWQLQEHLKGTVAFITDYGGWDFNLQDYFETDSLGNRTGERMPTSLANQIPDSELMIKPFFKRGRLIESLLDGGGSDFALANRNRLLSESFPALTLAVGMNNVYSVNPRNYDIQDVFKTRINDVPQWPRENGRWWHSDLKDIAYFYTFNLFNEFVVRGGLTQ